MSTHEPEPIEAVTPTETTAGVEGVPDGQEASRWAERATVDPRAFLPTGTGTGTPLTICRRYADGLIGRDQLIADLVAFPYTPAPRDAYDDVSPDPPGAWSELYLAEDLGLIDHDVYGEVFARTRDQPPTQ